MINPQSRSLDWISETAQRMNIRDKALVEKDYPRLLIARSAGSLWLSLSFQGWQFANASPEHQQTPVYRH